ncbi:hypothetical protein D3C86_1965490 [compost metagenome]
MSETGHQEHAERQATERLDPLETVDAREQERVQEGHAQIDACQPPGAEASEGDRPDRSAGGPQDEGGIDAHLAQTSRLTVRGRDVDVEQVVNEADE